MTRPRNCQPGASFHYPNIPDLDPDKGFVGMGWLIPLAIVAWLLFVTCAGIGVWTYSGWSEARLEERATYVVEGRR